MPRRAAAIAPLLLAAAAAAQTPAPESQPLAAPTHDSRDWSIRFEPAGWYVAPSGNMHLAGEPVGTSELYISDLNIDSPRLSPFGELHLKAANRWRFTLSAFAFQTEDRGADLGFSGFLGPIAVSEGDRVNTSLTFASGEAAAAWRIPHELGKQFEHFRGRIELIGGTRFTHIDLDIDTPGGSIDEEHFFLEPLVGAKLSMDITEQFTVDVQNTFGFFSTGDKKILSWDIFVGFMYFPTSNIGAQIGFRQYFFRLDDGSESEAFEYNGALAGLYGGLSIRF